MAMSQRHVMCPHCGKRVDRLQRAAPKLAGIYASYPCNCWHTPERAQAIVDAWRQGESP